MATPARQDPSITWGVLSLLGAAGDDLFEITAMSGETHLGNPVPLIEAVQSLLTEGALALVTGYDNREVPLRLKLSGDDGEVLALAEASLFQQCQLDQPPPLIYVGPLALTTTVAFDVVVAQLDQDTSDGWDLREINAGDVFYTLTLTCLPFVRAVESTVVEALAVPVDPETPVWVEVDDCESTTGWTRETNASFPTGPTVSVRPSVQVGALIDSPHDYLRLVRTGSITVPADHYLAIDVALSPLWNFTGHWTAYYNGTWHAPVSVGPGLGEGGTTRLFFEGVGTITSFKVAFDFASIPPGDSTASLDVFSVAYTDTIGSAPTTTTRQQSRLIEVEGAAPTQCQIRLYDATPDDLGEDILIYTSRVTAFQPNLRQWISSSESPSPNAGAVSGSVHDLTTDTVYLIPANLLTAGTYALLVRMDVGGLSPGDTVGWQARMVTADGTDMVGTGLVISGEIVPPLTGGPFRVFDVAAMILPVIEVEGDDHAVELTLSGTAVMTLDEAWLFSLDDGTLTWLQDGEGLDWLETRAPELGAARPSVWGGRNAVGSNPSCIDYKCASFGVHRLYPGTMQIFTVTSVSRVSQCSAEYFPRGHTRLLGASTS